MKAAETSFSESFYRRWPTAGGLSHPNFDRYFGGTSGEEKTLLTLSKCITVHLLGCHLAGVAMAAPPTRSPIKHVIVVVGENRSFDNLFGTYTPTDRTQSVFDRLSEGIVRRNWISPRSLRR